MTEPEGQVSLKMPSFRKSGCSQYTPIPSNQEYLLELINSVGVFISNLRWRCHFFLNPSNANPKETFGFKTNEPAPPVDELKVFENDFVPESDIADSIPRSLTVL